jgi:hypothetical protein
MNEWQQALAMWAIIVHIYSISLPNLNTDIQRAGQF